jgi:hypothetical protein
MVLSWWRRGRDTNWDFAYCLDAANKGGDQRIPVPSQVKYWNW